jgi:hypothetical protein
VNRGREKGWRLRQKYDRLTPINRFITGLIRGLENRIERARAAKAQKAAESL